MAADGRSVECIRMFLAVAEERHFGRAAVPLVDDPPVTTVIAWPTHSRSMALAGLVRVSGAL